jgi:hypothetical protein
MNCGEVIRRYPHWILITLLTILFLIILILSDGYPEGTDNISHYLLARYAFRNPGDFLNPWGRPLYTILSSPFAQFGFQGIRLFNVLLGIFTSYLTFLLVKCLKLPVPWLVLFFVLFTPLYCIMLFTALTEILCGFVLVLAVWLFFKERYIASAIAISFIPFARYESFIFFPLFILAFILRKRYKAIVFVLTGFLFFCIIGAYQYNDFFWPITHFPYDNAHYGNTTGTSFWRFIDARDLIWGLPLVVLMLFGIYFLIYRLFDRQREKRMEVLPELLLVLGSVSVYFFFHTYLFWKATGGSIGLIRVMAAILPLSAVISMRGYQFIHERLPGKKVGRMAFLIITILFLIYINFTTYKYPINPGPEESVLKKATDWLQKSPYSRNLIYYADMTVPFYLGMDPKDTKLSRQVHSSHDLKHMPDNSVIIWDAHFGPNESGISLDSLYFNPVFKLLKMVKPQVIMKTYGGYNYEVDVFLKLPAGIVSNNDSIREILEVEELDLVRTWKLDFEKHSDVINLSGLPTDTSYSGSYAYKFDGTNEFSPGVHCKINDLQFEKRNLQVQAVVYIKTDTAFPEGAASLVISLEDDHKSYHYSARYFNQPPVKPGSWQRVRLYVPLPEIKSNKDNLKVYIWNPLKKQFLIDDLVISVYEPK